MPLPIETIDDRASDLSNQSRVALDTGSHASSRYALRMTSQVLSRALDRSDSTSVCRAMFARWTLEQGEPNVSDVQVGTIADMVVNSSRRTALRRGENDDGRVSSSNLW